MKQPILYKVIALALIVLLCGCSAAPVIQEPTGDRSVLLVNPQGTGTAFSSAELPAIDDENALPIGEVKPASVNFSGDTGEVRAIWISYLEMQTLLTGKTEAQFRQNIAQVFDTVKNYGLNTVVVHVRPFGDALYDSQLFPWSHLITGTEGVDPGFDPLAVMVAEAKSRGLRFDAWVNPYRVRASNNNKPLSADNQAQKWLDAGDGAVIRYGEIISYNPASEKAQDHIVDGIREIVRNYDIDAIHIDDYFYPTTDAAFDSASYSVYQSGGGALSLADWRRSNVESLIQKIYAGVKAEKSGVLFGISPQGNVNINYNDQYLDVQKIAGNSGYCDYICPQIYYGFQNENQPYATVAENWNKMVQNSPVELYIGIGVYKLGIRDNWAGAGINEWVSTTTQLKDMVEHARSQSGCTGFVLYRYESLFQPESWCAAQVETERGNLKSIL